MTRADFRRQIDQLKASISLKDLVERDGHKIFRNGGLWKCLCPRHKERTPSCVIYADHLHCFGCHFHADIFQYVMEMTGCDFKTAVERLANGSVRTNRVTHRPIVKPKEPELPIDYFLNMMSDGDYDESTQAVLDLSVKLGVDFTSLWRLGARWLGKYSAYGFPMCDFRGCTIGIRLRDKNGKKWAVKGSKQGLFISESLPKFDLYVTEGPTDCAAMLSMGLFAIGKASAMQGPEEIIKFIVKNRIRRVIVIADNDTAGLNGAKKLIYVCPVPCCELVLPAKDAREFYRNGGTRELIENLLKSVVWRRNPNA